MKNLAFFFIEKAEKNARAAVSLYWNNYRYSLDITDNPWSGVSSVSILPLPGIEPGDLGICSTALWPLGYSNWRLPSQLTGTQLLQFVAYVC